MILKNKLPSIYRIIPEKISFFLTFEFKKIKRAFSRPLLQQFPHNSRIFTERIASSLQKNIFRFYKSVKQGQKRNFFTGSIIFISLILFSAVLYQGYNYLSLQKKIDIQKQEVENLKKEKVYWEKITRKYQGYRDANFRLALITYQLGDIPLAQHYLKETLQIDPNFKKGHEFGKKIGVE